MRFRFTSARRRRRSGGSGPGPRRQLDDLAEVIDLRAAGGSRRKARELRLLDFPLVGLAALRILQPDEIAGRALAGASLRPDGNGGPDRSVVSFLSLLRADGFPALDLISDPVFVDRLIAIN